MKMPSYAPAHGWHSLVVLLFLCYFCQLFKPSYITELGGVTNLLPAAIC